MSLERLILQIARKLIKPALIKGKVTSIDGVTCKVTPLSGDAEIPDVQLRSVVSDNPDENKPGMIIYPKKDSDVIVGMINNNTADYCICQYSEVDRVVITIGEIVLEVNKDGISLGKETKCDQKALLGDAFVIEQEKEKTRVDTIIQLLTGSAVTPVDGGTAFKSSMSSLTGLPAADYSNVKSTKVTLQ